MKQTGRDCGMHLSVFWRASLIPAVGYPDNSCVCKDASRLIGCAPREALKRITVTLQIKQLATLRASLLNILPNTSHCNPVPMLLLLWMGDVGRPNKL